MVDNEASQLFFGARVVSALSFLALRKYFGAIVKTSFWRSDLDLKGREVMILSDWGLKLKSIYYVINRWPS